jgi:rhamnose transport system permease protein
MWLKSPAFFSIQNLNDIAVNTSYLAISALGMMFVIVIGQIDVSVGAILAICCTLTGILSKSGIPILWVAFITLLAGAALGTINGLLVSICKIHSIVATLGTLSIYRGVLIYYTKGIWITSLPDSLLKIGRGKVLGFPIAVVLTACAFFAVSFAFRYIRAGRYIFAVGSNQESARLSGISIARVQISAFLCNGLLVGLSALIFAGRFGGIQSNTGQGYELSVITAVVVGGANIFGGSGTPLGTLLGALMVSIIGTSLIFFNVSAFWEQAVQGTFILLAVIYYSLQSKRKIFIRITN